MDRWEWRRKGDEERRRERKCKGRFARDGRDARDRRGMKSDEE
jgi:hypothetical protein